MFEGIGFPTIEGVGICVAVLIIQLIALYFIDKRLDYAQMNHSYAADWGSSKGSNAVAANKAKKVGSAVKKRKAKSATAANDELP